MNFDSLINNVIEFVGGEENFGFLLFVFASCALVLMIVLVLRYFSTRQQLLLEIVIGFITFSAYESHGSIALLAGLIAFLLVQLSEDLISIKKILPLIKSNLDKPYEDQTIDESFEIPTYTEDGGINLKKLDKNTQRDVYTVEFWIGIFFFLLFFILIYIVTG